MTSPQIKSFEKTPLKNKAIAYMTAENKLLHI